MQHLAVEVGDMVLPKGLPAGEDELFQLLVRRDEHERRRSLETDPSLDAEYRVPEMHASAHPVGTAENVQRLDQVHPTRCLPSKLVGTPFAKPITTETDFLAPGAQGAGNALSGISAHGSWVSFPPTVVPHNPEFTE